MTDVYRRSERANRGAKLVSVLAIAALAFGVLLGETAANTSEGKIESRVLRDTTGGREASFVIHLKDQADLSAAHAIKGEDARGRYVYRTLEQHAARTQAPIRALLDSRGISYKSFWVANVIVAKGDRSLVEDLAARRDVKVIESNAKSSWISATPDAPAKSEAPNVVELGVIKVRAPEVWAAGYTGQGIVIANQDTGVRWTHNALKPHYRGWNGSTADHNYNWHDSIHSGGGSCGPNRLEPCDDNGHGTHTTGTTSGNDNGTNQIGVAPGAKWIGCRNMDQGVGTPATYTECFQFFIAPTDLNGNNPDPTRRPHVMNNSWGCPPSEGCAAETLRTIIENTEAAGIFVEASAGNAGYGCSTVNDPPAIYAASFSTGAISSSTTSLASFSSRGPVTVDGSGRMKPDIVAPGVNVRSATRTSNTSYGSLSGTSMAGPHVVGVVALLWSARPELVRNVPATKQLLRSTADPAVSVPNNGGGCGGSTPVPNNHFGWGLVDAFAAYDAQPPPPANDNFANATVLSWTFSGAVNGTIAGATGEAGEPVHNGAINSVWYRFTPARSTLVTFGTCTGTSYDSYLAAYTGATLSALTQVAANDNACGVQSRISFVAVAGTTYRVVVDGAQGATGPFTLTYSERARPYHPRSQGRLR